MTTDVTLNGTALSSAVPSAKVLGVTRELLGRRRFNRIDIPGRAGSWHYDEEPGDRELVVGLDIQADTFAARRAAVRALAYWCDVGAVSRLIVDDETDRYHDAIVANGDSSEWLNNATIDLRFLVGPYALAIASTSTSISAAGGTGSGSFAVGDEVTAEPVIELTPAGGTLTGFTLTINGYALTWAGPDVIAATESLTVNAISSTVTLGANDDVDLTGAYDVLALSMSDVSGEFPLILEGTASWSLEYTGTATSVAASVEWRERFR